MLSSTKNMLIAMQNIGRFYHLPYTFLITKKIIEHHSLSKIYDLLKDIAVICSNNDSNNNSTCNIVFNKDDMNNNMDNITFNFIFDYSLDMSRNSKKNTTYPYYTSITYTLCLNEARTFSDIVYELSVGFLLNDEIKIKRHDLYSISNIDCIGDELLDYNFIGGDEAICRTLLSELITLTVCDFSNIGVENYNDLIYAFQKEKSKIKKNLSKELNDGVITL